MVSLALHLGRWSPSAKAVCNETPSLDPHNFGCIKQHKHSYVIIFPPLDKMFKQQIKQRKQWYFQDLGRKLSSAFLVPVNIFLRGKMRKRNISLVPGIFLDAGSTHLHTGSLRWSEETVGTTWTNCSSSPGAHRSADVYTHTYTHTHLLARIAFFCGPASKSSFPEGLIMPSAQYGKSISVRSEGLPFLLFLLLPSSAPPTQICILLAPTPASTATLSTLLFWYSRVAWNASILSLLFPPFYWEWSEVSDGSSSGWHLPTAFTSFRCDSLGADDVWDQTVRRDPSQRNSRRPGKRGATPSAAHLYHRCLYDHGEM